MTQASILVLSDTGKLACLFFIFLVPLAGAGLSVMNTGLGRSKSAAHMMMATLCAIAIAGIVYFFCGFAWQGFVGSPRHTITLGGKSWDWIGAGHFFLRGVPLDGSSASLTALLQIFTVGLAGMIALGSGGDRWRLRATCASTVILAGFTYPLFAHWVWGGGWMAQLGVNYGLGQGFVDPGGASTVHAVGGLSALCVAWILGPRHGKYSRDGMAPAMPGHNAVLVLFGCSLALVGWIGLNCSGAILYTGVRPGSAVLIAINTVLSAAAAGLTAAAITGIRFGKPDASLTANGWVGGLVASAGCCAFVVPPEAIVIGSIAGALVIYSVELFETKMEVDDPGGTISVHAVAGIWGILALGIFARFAAPVLNVVNASIKTPALSSSALDSGQWLAQAVGVATLIGFVLPVTYGLNWMLNRFCPFRVGIEGERQGMDLTELGAGAYPEFVTHSEDFLPR
jgi:Amt family ammonium transporter